MIPTHARNIWSFMIDTLLSRVVWNVKFIQHKEHTGSYPKNSGQIAIKINNSGLNKSIHFLTFFPFSKIYIKEEEK
jgi:hypothetical protein